jgi:hypothetical protein
MILEAMESLLALIGALYASYFRSTSLIVIIRFVLLDLFETANLFSKSSFIITANAYELRLPPAPQFRWLDRYVFFIYREVRVFVGYHTDFWIPAIWRPVKVSGSVSRSPQAFSDFLI